MLGKDVVATFANKIIPKMAVHAEKKSTFVAKLRVSLETLHYLTKPKQNQLILIRQRFANDLLNILSRLELLAEPGRNLIKIAGAILSVCLHLVPSRTGRQQFVENGGVEILKRFCFNVAGEKVDKRWDRLLCRSCVILSRCCPSASLPVSSDGCPIKFDISREHSFLPEGTNECSLDISNLIGHPSDETGKEALGQHLLKITQERQSNRSQRLSTFSPATLKQNRLSISTPPFSTNCCLPVLEGTK
jgi:hypothetical protein